MLAWLDAELKIYSAANNAKQTAIKLTQVIYQYIQNAGLATGHLKFLIDDAIKISYTSSAEKEIIVNPEPASSAFVLLNARVQTTPAFLSNLINHAIQKVETETNCTIVQESFSSFQPGYPKPTYRIAD